MSAKPLPPRGPRPTLAVAAPFQKHLAKSTLLMAERLLAQGGTVVREVFLRSAIGGEVLAQNGRRFQPLLAVAEGGRLVRASCSCAARLLSPELCPHVAALAHHFAKTGDASIALPQRFDASLGALLCEEAVSLGEPLLSREDGKYETRLTARSAAGALLVSARVPRDEKERLLEIFPGGEGPPIERALREAVATPEEVAFRKAGSASRRERFETSFWGRLANRLFLLFGDGTSGVLLDADESGFVLVFQDAEREVRVAAPRAAVSRVLRRMPSLPWTSGFAVEEGAAAAALSLELLADGALALRPVVVTVGEARVYERPSVAPFLLDQHVLLPGARTLLGLLAARRPFAEPETGDQALLDFGGEGYRPSPIGLPLDRETLVPREKVPRFLARHRAEIDALPEVLVPEELRGGGLLRVSGARLHLVSDSRSHLVVELFLLMKEREVPLGTVLTARRAKEKLLSFGGRLLDLTDPALDFVDLLGKGAIEGAGDAVRLRLTPLELCLVRAYLRGPVSITSESGVSPAALERLESSSPSAPPPPSLGVSLFPFQEAGLSWLWFLRQNGFGGLLCDDMGLGKTHQAMALIAAMTRDGGEAPSVLVVCPASVIPHWEEKLSKVLPGIPLVTHHGASRRELKPRPGVTLTTWGTLRSDVAGESPLAPFDLAVFDEIQQAKSPASQVHRAARHVAAGMKLGLTGTPIENTTADLVALLGLVVPGLLPEAPAARRAFESDEGRDLESRGRLSRLVKPFVLRRTKAQVLDGLPPKILDTRRCELSPEQKALYQDTLKGAQGLRDALGTSDRVSYLHVFAVLSRLKRICDHPALVGGSEDAGSGKWDLFTELLEESLASSLKVVVFTQYLGMLKLFARHLSGKGVGFAEIKGDTKDRAEPVTRFREDPKCRVFLASLKAGGVGIDLTPASVVIHYDRWWNAAREEQATDRVHRLGQKRGVHVLRLVTKGTLEERIDWLIEQKAALLGEVVPEDDPSLVKQFERSELVDLLSGPAFG